MRLMPLFLIDINYLSILEVLINLYNKFYFISLGRTNKFNELKDKYNLLKSVYNIEDQTYVIVGWDRFLEYFTFFIYNEGKGDLPIKSKSGCVIFGIRDVHGCTVQSAPSLFSTFSGI